MKKYKPKQKPKYKPRITGKERKIRIDHKTIIITTSPKSDEEVRQAYLEKLTGGSSPQHKRRPRGNKIK